MSSESDRIERAGDYIMGRMSEAERERAERDLQHDPQFRETVIRLAERLRARAPEQRDKSDLWNSVLDDIAGLPQMRDAPVVRQRQARAAGERRAPVGRALGGWRGAAALAALAAAGSAGFLAAGWMADADDTVALVRLSDADGRTAGMLEIGSDDDLRFLPLEMGQQDDGQVLQLWTVTDGAAAPVSLGTLARSQTLRWRGPDLSPLRPGQSFTITAASPADAALGLPGGETLFEGSAELVSRP